MATEKTDVVIVGAGAAGGILAAELGKAGMKVIGLERGPRLTTKDFAPQDELRYFQRQDLRPEPQARAGHLAAQHERARATRCRPLNNGNQAGGGTVHYGSVSWRFHEDDFRVRSQTIERYGASAIPEDSSVIDWPLSYADLEPFYDRAEYELGVSGKAGNLQGTKIDGGNVFEAPRKRDYPLPPLLVDQVGHASSRPRPSKLGYHPFSTPRAILSQPYNGRPGCTYCGFCQAFGCHVGAKSSILVTKLPEADATGNFKLITGAMCYRVNSDNSGRATGVSYYGPDRSDNTIEADIVILAPFIYDNVRLLLLSKTDEVPERARQFERPSRQAHHGAHWRACFVAFDDRHVNVYMGPSAQKHTIDDFNADNFDHKDLGFIRGAQISAGPASLEGGPIAHRHEHEPAARRPALGRAYRDFLAQVLHAPPAMTGQTENLPYARPDHRPRSECARRLGPAGAAHDLRLAAAKRASARRVRRRTSWRRSAARWGGAGVDGAAGPGAPGAHHEGGTRMGSDPKTSVVNATARAGTSRTCSSWAARPSRR